jgi:hypothetical protein
MFVTDEKTRSVTEGVQVLKGGKEQNSAQCALSIEYHRHQIDEDKMSSGWDGTDEKYVTKIFVRKPEGLRTLGKHKHIRRKMTMGQETECHGGKLNHWFRERKVAIRCEHDNETSNLTRFIF